MMKKISILLFVLLIVIGYSITAHAALILRGVDSLGNQLIYDTDFDITWYDYNHTRDTWDNQMAWADALSVDFGGIIFDDWRLPTALNQDGTGPCLGWNCTESEMGHLFYTELENFTGQTTIKSEFTDALTGLSESFLSLSYSYYWSSTEYATDPDNAWFFIFGASLGPGFQSYAPKSGDSTFYGWGFAVLDGDIVDVDAVPLPSTLLLFGTGLAGIIGTKFRKRKSKHI